MIYTLLDARKAVAKYVLGGRCFSDSSVLNAINESIEILIDEGDWKHTVQKIVMATTNKCIALPKGVETILKANYCRNPMNVWTHGWEFLSSGPGTLEYGGDNGIYNDMADMGWHPTFYPLGGLSLKLLALSTDASDVDLKIKIWGRAGILQEEVFDNLSPDGRGESLGIIQWDGGVDGSLDKSVYSVSKTANDYRQITRIEKPVTNGYVTLVGIDDDDNIAFLAKYSPLETVPSYRRYRVTGMGKTEASNIVMLVKMGYYPLVNDEDVLSIQHLPAIRQMIMAQQEKRDGEFQKGIALHADAVRLLHQQLGNAIRNTAEFDVRVEGGYEFGSTPNII